MKTHNYEIVMDLRDNLLIDFDVTILVFRKCVFRRLYEIIAIERETKDI